MCLLENLQSQIWLAVYFHWTVLGSRCWGGPGELGYILQNRARLEGGDQCRAASLTRGHRTIPMLGFENHDYHHSSFNNYSLAVPQSQS